MDEALQVPREDGSPPGEAAPATPLRALMAAIGASFVWRQEAGWKAYAGTTVMVLLALGLGLALRQYLGSLNIALVFLTAVLGSATA